MKAAVVSDVTSPPRYADFPEPPVTDDVIEVRMLAAGVHNLVRSVAAGAHYRPATTYPSSPGSTASA
ncbi:hypothetical protein ABLE92_25070 [Gordonia sp. VNQ95]|uniref:hypothetical protein n=1 Tax=Gordonia sp. VNQ95 TaxID=3156619 RepID=UPI0032B55452